MYCDIFECFVDMSTGAIHVKCLDINLSFSLKIRDVPMLK